ncbi:MAG: class I SAM-dependent methyltransferase [Thermoproteus sp.]|nr:class I SAM-dependent methyltransferase [Thermoproteus sp.]
MDRRGLLKLLGDCSKIADIGCGDAIYVWAGRPPDNVYCIDIDYYPHLAVQADARMLPLRSNAFDCALLMEILEHVDNVEATIREALRVARKIAISYPHETMTIEQARRHYAGILDFLKTAGIKHKPLETTPAPGGVHVQHWHWKSEEQIKSDVEAITRLCGPPIELDYGIYRGWGWICSTSGHYLFSTSEKPVL